MRGFVTALTAVLGGLALLPALEHKAEAQEIVLTGPLKGAPPVIHLRQYRKSRFEIAPMVSFTLLDEYRRNIIMGGRLQYYFTDWLGVGLWGGGAVSTTTDLTDQTDEIAPRDAFTATNVAPNKASQNKSPNFTDQTASMAWMIAPQVTAIPFRGKLALFQKLFVDTEAYFFAGVAFAGLNERADCGNGNGEPVCSDVKSFTLTSRLAVAPTFGLGLSFFLADFINLGVEWRAMPFSWNRGGFDSRGSGPNNNFPDGKINGDDQTFKFNQMIGISVGFMLGKRTTSTYTPGQTKGEGGGKSDKSEKSDKSDKSSK